MGRARAKLAVLCLGLLLAACNPVVNYHGAKAQVARFHDLYDKGEVKELYAMTGSQFRQTTTLARFKDIVDTVHSSLGEITSSKQESFTVNTTNGTTRTSIVMDTQFARGKGRELFIFIGNGDAMHLEGWHVESDKLPERYTVSRGGAETGQAQTQAAAPIPTPAAS